MDHQEEWEVHQAVVRWVASQADIHQGCRTASAVVVVDSSERNSLECTAVVVEQIQVLLPPN